MAVSKAQQASVNKYVKANYDRINVTFPKGRKEEIQAHAAARGESVNGFIGRAIDETMERDAGRLTEAPAGAGAILSPDTLQAAQEAAGLTGEAVPQFVTRAVQTQTKRDETTRHMGLNPVTGNKMKLGNETE